VKHTLCLCAFMTTIRVAYCKLGPTSPPVHDHPRWTLMSCPRGIHIWLVVPNMEWQILDEDPDVGHEHGPNLSEVVERLTQQSECFIILLH
jgi:hypothetical protein